MPKDPVTIPGTDEIPDEGDDATLGIMDLIEKIGGKGDPQPGPPPPEDTSDDEARTPTGLP